MHANSQIRIESDDNGFLYIPIDGHFGIRSSLWAWSNPLLDHVLCSIPWMLDADRLHS
jgi:hypothetical protein